MHHYVFRDRLEVDDFEWLHAVGLQCDVGKHQLISTHAIQFLDTLGISPFLHCDNVLAHTTFSLYLHNQPVDVLHDLRIRVPRHTEHAHGAAYETTLTFEFRLQLAHFILVHVLAAQRCESITVVTGERRQLMERCQHTFRRDGRSEIE